MVYGEQIENIIKEMEADRPVPLGLTKAALTLMPSLKKKDGLFIPPEPNVLRSAQYTMPQNIDASEQNTMPRHPHDHYIMVMRMSTIIFAFSFGIAFILRWTTGMFSCIKAFYGPKCRV